MYIPALSSAQFGDPGPYFSFGVGPGYSAHADSYRKFEAFRVREYTGFRGLNADARFGWKFGESTLIYLSGQYSPSNTTISPYRSAYAGLHLAKSLYAIDPFYILAGYGYNRAGIESDREVGSGYLTTLGAGAKVSQHFQVESSVTFGAMDEDNYLKPNPFDARETRWQAIFSFVF